MLCRHFFFFVSEKQMVSESFSDTSCSSCSLRGVCFADPDFSQTTHAHTGVVPVEQCEKNKSFQFKYVRTNHHSNRCKTAKLQRCKDAKRHVLHFFVGARVHDDGDVVDGDGRFSNVGGENNLRGAFRRHKKHRSLFLRGQLRVQRQNAVFLKVAEHGVAPHGAEAIGDFCLACIA